MEPLVFITLSPSKLSCSGQIIKSKLFNETLGSWIWILKISFPNLFFKAIDGITLFLPQEIMILESQINFSVNKSSEMGVNFGGIKFQKGFNFTVDV